MRSNLSNEGLNSKLGKNLAMRYSFCFVCLVILSACQRQGDQSQSHQTETSQVNYGVEQNPPQANIASLTATEVQNLIALQDRIVQQPDEIAFRRELGEKAIHAQAGVVWTVGRARLPGGASAGAVAKSQAEVAARIDAGRWAAYLLEWRQNDYATNFGSIQAKVPGNEVVNTSCTDSTCVVLVKTLLRNFP